jgi:hypothetical protein
MSNELVIPPGHPQYPFSRYLTPLQGNASNGNWMVPMEYAYLTEFQAHHPDFDYLKSIEIAEKINSISWLKGTGSSHLLLSANDKQAKLWKVRCATLMCWRQ